jgi:hypothetical protein
MEIAINKKNKALLRDEVAVYRLEENPRLYSFQYQGIDR